MLIGLLGKTNVGKTTFFNAATMLNAQIADHPFTTIEPNMGVAYARVDCVCREFNIKDNPRRSACIDGRRFIPVKMIDVAGLVPDAHKGRGLGNKFLDDARQADVLIHVVDASGSTDSEGRRCEPGSNDPLKDIEFVELEFDLWLASIIARDWARSAKEAEHKGLGMEHLLANRLSGLAIDGHVIADTLNAMKGMGRLSEWGEDDILRFARALRIRAKPILIAANKADVHTARENIERMRATGRVVVPCIAEAELLLRRAASKGLVEYVPGDAVFRVRDGSLTMEQRRALEKVRALMEDYGGTGVQKAINAAVLDMLHMITVYPVEDEHRLTDKDGNVLPDAFLLKQGSTARDLAMLIHSDLARNLLYAIDARTKQRLSAEYRLRDRDIIKIVSASR
ncbi:MAG: redox-regulated ATPase YchF [Candidatus Nitrosocaldus sp.]|nr:redox-regulated ATPase YchF [Candidatus Nitrosocaldus sp.]MDW8000801.1 redox-regulated ATPase YchF [Candidatus Nitrosocaldus sp.]